MSDEEEKTQEEIEKEAWDESDSEPPEKEGEEDEPEKTPEKVEEKKKDKEGGEELPEDEEKEKEEIDWEAEAKKEKERAEKAEKERDTQKRFAEEQARQKAESEKKAAEAEKKKEEEELEKTPEEVEAYLEENPEAKGAIEHLAKRIATQIINKNTEAILEATGGRDAAEFIKDISSRINQVEFERVVRLGYFNDAGKHVPGHPDVVEVVMSQEFQDFMAEQATKDPKFRERQKDPIESIEIISVFKEKQLEKAAEKDKNKQRKTKEETEEQLSGADKTTTRKATETKPDAYDEDKAWEDAKKAADAL